MNKRGGLIFGLLAALLALVLTGCPDPDVEDENGYKVQEFSPVTVTTTTEWNDAIAAINSFGGYGSPDADTQKNYTIIVDGDFTVAGNLSSTFANIRHLRVTLKGDGTVSLSSQGHLFSLYGEQTLIIDSPDLILQGSASNNKPLLNISAINGGSSDAIPATLELRNGAITGNGSGSWNGGVKVVDGAFTMSGGEISDNGGGGVSIWASGTFIMSDGVIKGNTSGSGGGVFVIKQAGEHTTFRKTGGIIYGYNGSGSSNPLWNHSISGQGHAVLFNDNSSGQVEYYRNTSLFAGDTISTDQLGIGNNWTREVISPPG